MGVGWTNGCLVEEFWRLEFLQRRAPQSEVSRERQEHSFRLIHGPLVFNLNKHPRVAWSWRRSLIQWRCVTQTHTAHNTHKKRGRPFTFLFGVLRHILLSSLPVLLHDASWHLALCYDVMGDGMAVLMKVYFGHGGR